MREQNYGPEELIIKGKTLEFPCLYLIVEGEVDISIDCGC